MCIVDAATEPKSNKKIDSSRVYSYIIVNDRFYYKKGMYTYVLVHRTHRLNVWKKTKKGLDSWIRWLVDKEGIAMEDLFIYETKYTTTLKTG